MEGISKCYRVGESEVKDRKALQSEEWCKIILESKDLGLRRSAWYLVEELDHSTLKFQDRVGHLDYWKLNLITISCEIKDLDLIL